MSQVIELKANVGFVIRGDFLAISHFMAGVGKLVSESGVQLVHHQASASKLWIQEGGQDEY